MKTIKQFRTDADKILFDAESKSDLKKAKLLLTKSNAFKRAANDK